MTGPFVFIVALRIVEAQHDRDDLRQWHAVDVGFALCVLGAVAQGHGYTFSFADEVHCTTARDFMPSMWASAFTS